MRRGWAEDGGILEIHVNNLGQPIEETCSRLASNLGVLARNGHLAPLTYLDWRHVPDIGKDAIWTHIKENTNATDQMRKFMITSVGRKWKEWKAEVKRQGYTKYMTNEERLKHCPPWVEESQWPRLIYYWDSDKGKAKSEKNKAIRKNWTTPHTSGRTPHAEVRNKLAKSIGYEPTRRMVYKETHVTKGKGPVNEIAAKAIQEMDELEAENPETGVARDDIYGRVMGRDRHGRVGTYGLGATPTMVFGPSYKLSQDERREIETQHQQELENLRREMEAENERVRREMMAENERNKTEMKEQMELQMQEKLFAVESRMNDRMEAQIQNLLESHLRDMGAFSQSPRDVSSGTEQSAHIQSEVQSRRQTQPSKRIQLQPPKQAQLQRPKQVETHTVPRSQLRSYCEDLMAMKRAKKN
ncbi:uncharacterized protein M6B38_143770 [Iris pallida]|uniref:Transposase n=1 Tax=Iris pallida TaxID=29817 RepID=A0AAX6FBG7_IRIPA|nr:uncharacterized protein M6B38_143770 [Iris pallida]